MKTAFACMLAGCLLAACNVGCRAQNPPQPGSTDSLTPQLIRKIDVLVRSQYDIPPTMEVTLGTPGKSAVTGYRTLPITFSNHGQSQTVDFLLSDDGNTLARLEKFDLSRDPERMIPIEGRPIRGVPAAKVTIINFDDLECPYCAEMHAELFPETADHYKGLVRFIYKDFPLTSIHPWAMHAAVNAECLASQSGEAYWSYLDYVHAHASEIGGASRDVKLATATLDKLAHDQGVKAHLDMPKLAACTEKQDETPVRESMKLGEKLGIRGTPTMFINGERVAGMLPRKMLWQTIDRAIVAAGEQPPPNDLDEAPAQPAQAHPPQESGQTAAK